MNEKDYFDVSATGVQAYSPKIQISKCQIWFIYQLILPQKWNIIVIVIKKSVKGNLYKGMVFF